MPIYTKWRVCRSIPVELGVDDSLAEPAARVIIGAARGFIARRMTYRRATCFNEMQQALSSSDERLLSAAVAKAALLDVDIQLAAECRRKLNEIIAAHDDEEQSSSLTESALMSSLAPGVLARMTAAGSSHNHTRHNYIGKDDCGRFEPQPYTP